MGPDHGNVLSRKRGMFGRYQRSQGLEKVFVFTQHQQVSTAAGHLSSWYEQQIFGVHELKDLPERRLSMLSKSHPI